MKKDTNPRIKADDHETLYSFDEIACFYNVTTRKLKNYVKEGSLLTIKNGKEDNISLEAVIDWDLKKGMSGFIYNPKTPGYYSLPFSGVFEVFHEWERMFRHGNGLMAYASFYRMLSADGVKDKKPVLFSETFCRSIIRGKFICRY